MQSISKVLVSDPISNKGLEILSKARSLSYDLKHAAYHCGA